MTSFLDLIARLRRDESGVTAVEYGLIASLIAVVISGSLMSIGASLCAVFSTLSPYLGGVPIAC